MAGPGVSWKGVTLKPGSKHLVKILEVANKSQVNSTYEYGVDCIHCRGDGNIFEHCTFILKVKLHEVGLKDIHD